MKILFPTTKPEARALIAKLGDYVDGVPDEHFDARTALQRAGANFADDLGESLIWVCIGIALWELFWAAWSWWH